MKVSQELLNKLSGQKYEDYLGLEKARKFWWTFFWWITFILFLTTYSTTAFLIFTKVLGETKYCLGVLFAFCTLGLFGAIFEGEFDKYYTRIFNYFFHKTNIHSKIEGLSTYFESTKKQIEDEEKKIEQKAILILSKVEIEARKRLKENRNINYDLRLKRKWRSWYAEDLETVRKNCEMNSKDLEIVNANLKFIKFDADKQRHFTRLKNELENPFSYHFWLTWKISNLYDRPTSTKRNPTDNTPKAKESNSNDFLKPSFDSEPKINEPKITIPEKDKKTPQFPKPRYFHEIRQGFWGNPKPLSINSSNYLSDSERKIPITETVETKIENEKSDVKENLNNQSPNNKTEVDNQIQKQHSTQEVKKKNNQEKKQLSLDFENQKYSLKELKNLPIVKKKRMTYEGIIKASPDFYRELADKKILIGEKGELLVMEYEKERLRIETKANVIQKLEHTSKTRGDGYGYDICSIENQKEIYIEVKTTTGNFQTNLFFTNRELEAMNKYDKSYYLYRIFNFNEIENTGNLYVFRGKNEIANYFNFNPTVYKLEPRNNESID